jgi:hypothetical protein
MELNKETERLMVPVDAAISRHVKWLSDAWTDIHNRASSAIETAVVELATEKARNARIVEWMRGKCGACGTRSGCNLYDNTMPTWIGPGPCPNWKLPAGREE